MRSPHPYLALLFATILAFQVQSFKLTSSQEPLALQSDPHNFASRLGFKDLLKAAYEAQSSTQILANVYNYYLDGRLYHNYIESLYCQANTDSAQYITLKQFYEVTDGQDVHRVDATRVSAYVRGVFGSIHNDDENTPIDAFSFNQAVDLLFAESVSFVTFSYITKSSKHNRHVTISFEEAEEGLIRIFNLLKDHFPLPDCQELGYLFKQADVDKDGRHNLQEFHVFLSIYLRFYKYGIQNNRYAAVVMKDKVYEYVFNNEDGLGSRTDRNDFLKIAFKRFLQMTLYDKIQNQMAHLFFTKFDSDGSGAIDRDEFKALMSFFSAPYNEVDVLFIAADTDGSGEIDFAEWVVTITTLLRKLTADFGYNLITVTGGKANVVDSYAIFHEVEVSENTDLITAEKFKEIYDSSNVNNSEVLSEEEFATFVSQVIAYIRTGLRIQEESVISTVAGLNVDTATAQDVIAIAQEGSEQATDISYSLNEDFGLSSDETDLDETIADDIDLGDIIDQVEENTGATTTDIQTAVTTETGSSTLEQVIQTITQTTTEDVIDTVTHDVIETIQTHTEDCPTKDEVVDAIHEVINGDTIDTIIEDAANTSGQEIIDTVVEATTTEHNTEAAQLAGLDTKAIIDAVEEDTGKEITATEIVQIIQNKSKTDTAEGVVEVVENTSTEDLIQTVTTAVQEELGGSDEESSDEEEHHSDDGSEESDQSEHSEESDGDDGNQETIIQQVEQETGVSLETIENAVDQQDGGTISQVIDAANDVATETVINTITDAVIEQTKTEDCVTEAGIEQAIEDVVENGAIDDLVEQVEQDIASGETDITTTIEETIQENQQEEQIQQETEQVSTEIEDAGYTTEEFETAIEDQLGGATLEDVIEAANTAATEDVIETITETIAEHVDSEDCVTEESIEEAIDEAIENGAVDDAVEELESASTAEILDTISAEIQEGSDGESDSDETGGSDGESDSDETGGSYLELSAKGKLKHKNFLRKLRA